MKRIFKTTLVMAMVVAMILCSNVFALAAEVSTFAPDTTAIEVAANNEAVTYGNYYGSYNVSTSWKTVAYSTSGFNCNVSVKCTNLDLEPSDIRLLDKNGNVLWSEAGLLGPTGTRVYWCGSDVYKIQVKSHSGTSVVITTQSS